MAPPRYPVSNTAPRTDVDGRMRRVADIVEYEHAARPEPREDVPEIALGAVGSIPDVLRGSEEPPRVAHGYVILLRVIDAGRAELMPRPPDEFDAPFGGEPVEVAVRGGAGAAEIRVGEAPPQPASVLLDGADLAVVVGAERYVFAYAEDGDVAWLGRDGTVWALREQEQLDAARHSETAGASGSLRAPMPGVVALVAVGEGDRVAAGQTLVVVEAMKMEHPVVAPADGTVLAVHVAVGEGVEAGAPLLAFEPDAVHAQEEMAP